jgi:hypothetical protein
MGDRVAVCVGRVVDSACARRWLLVIAPLFAACDREIPPVPVAPSIGQWIWTRADVARFAESRAARPELEAAVFIGAIQCDASSGQLEARAGLSAADANAAHVTAVIRFEDGLDACRRANDSAAQFNTSLDSAVRVLRSRGASTPVAAVQLDYDAPQRALSAWAGSVRYLTHHALAKDSVWVTSIVAHLREPGYGDLFRDVVRGHVLQVFDTGEPSTPERIDEAIRLATRARMPFQLGLGAFERETRNGRTDHRIWFATVPRFSVINGYRGLWVFPAGRRWLTFLEETA